MTEPEKNERDPREVKMLGDGYELALKILESAKLETISLIEDGDYSTLKPIQALALAHVVMANEWAQLARDRFEREQICGWCARARATERGVSLAQLPATERQALRCYTFDEVQAHTLECEHNPLVQRIREARGFVSYIKVDAETKLEMVRCALGEEPQS